MLAAFEQTSSCSCGDSSAIFVLAGMLLRMRLHGAKQSGIAERGLAAIDIEKAFAANVSATAELIRRGPK